MSIEKHLMKEELMAKREVHKDGYVASSTEREKNCES